MLGAVYGDKAGSLYEFGQLKEIKSINPKELITSESFYSDDTIETVAVADAISPVRKPLVRPEDLAAAGRVLAREARARRSRVAPDLEASPPVLITMRAAAAARAVQERPLSREI